MVDEVKSLVGGTCTIFQKMNAEGDMLRVCTNVQQKDGTRAIGTYIPARNPDGTPNPVVAALLRGERYVGRAFVVNDWYVTAYEPLKDAKNELIGAHLLRHQAGTAPRSPQGHLRRSSPARPDTCTSSAAQATTKGKYILSHKGQRDGENIWDAKDADGNLFIQSAVKKALATKDGNATSSAIRGSTRARPRPAGRSPRRPISSRGIGSSVSAPTKTTTATR